MVLKNVVIFGYTKEAANHVKRERFDYLVCIVIIVCAYVQNFLTYFLVHMTLLTNTKRLQNVHKSIFMMSQQNVLIVLYRNNGNHNYDKDDDDDDDDDN